jgi:LPS O-antigen subunit length determinant protein (WzzB/FepE family)
MKIGEDSHPPRDESDRYPDPGDEATLADYLQVLWKWKWLVVIGTLAVVTATALYDYQLPRIFEVSAVIEPGLAGGRNDRGDLLFLDSSENIASKINEKTYNRKIAEELKLDPEQWDLWPEAKTYRRTETNIVRVLIESPLDQADRGKEVLSSLIRMIASDYEKEVNYSRSRNEEKIILKRSDLNTTTPVSTI